MPINLVDNFNINSELPIDSRLVVDDQSARESIEYKYDGLRVFQLDNRTHYIWNADTDSWDEDGNFNGSGTTYSLAMWESGKDLGDSPVTSYAKTIYEDNAKVLVGSNGFSAEEAFQVNSNYSDDTNINEFGTSSMPFVIHKGGGITTLADNWYHEIGTGDNFFNINFSSSLLEFKDGGFSFKGKTASSLNINSYFDIYSNSAQSQGDRSFASGESSHAEGLDTIAGISTYAFGSGTSITIPGIDYTNFLSTNIPLFIKSDSNSVTDISVISFTFSGGSTNITTGSTISGLDTLIAQINTGYGQHSEGKETRSIGDYSHAEGISTQAIGAYSHAEGYYTQAIGAYSHAEGISTQAIGAYSHAEGIQTISNGDAAHAEGISTQAIGAYSHAEGIQTISNGNASHAEGIQTISNGVSHAEGIQTISNGNAAHAEGIQTISNGDAAHAEGISTYANGNYSHSEGSYTNAVGAYSHAEGISTYANGDGSHAEGISTYANGNYSHAEGFNTTTYGAYSHAGGNNTIATYDYMYVIGQYNSDPITGTYSQALFVIGNGTSLTASNIFEVLSDRVLIKDIIEYSNNSSAISAGLTAGTLYRTGEFLKVVY